MGLTERNTGPIGLLQASIHRWREWRVIAGHATRKLLSGGIPNKFQRREYCHDAGGLVKDAIEFMQELIDQHFRRGFAILT